MEKWSAILTAAAACIAAVGSLVASLRNFRRLRIVGGQVTEIHNQINSRLDQLVEALKASMSDRDQAVKDLAGKVEELRQEKLKGAPKV